MKPVLLVTGTPKHNMVVFNKAIWMRQGQTIQRSRLRAFTLIEIMVVLFIISLIVTLTLINTNFGYTDEKRLQSNAENLVAQLKLAKQMALFQQAPVRFVQMGQQTGFQKFAMGEKQSDWQWITRDDLLSGDYLKDNIVTIQGEAIFFPNGRIQPFIITIANRNQKWHREIQGLISGEIVLRAL